MSIDDDTYHTICQRLGREPRGLRGVVAWRAQQPAVIQVDSLVNDKPFPTLFWLIDPEINYALDRLEARGFIARLQTMIDQDSSLQEQLGQNHRDHIELRNRLMPRELASTLKNKGFWQVLQKRGIGGIENFSRIRCLHTYYAAHLVHKNAVGTLIEQLITNETDPIFDVIKNGAKRVQ